MAVNLTTNRIYDVEVKLKVMSSEAIAGYKYSIDGGVNWSSENTEGIDASYSSMMAVFTVQGLEPLTIYNFKVKVKNSSGQWAESNIASAETRDIPHCISAPNFKVGEAVTLQFYNPLNRAFTVNFYKKGAETRLFQFLTNGTTYTGLNSETQIEAMLQSLADSNGKAEYKIECVFASNKKTISNGSTYSGELYFPTINEENVEIVGYGTEHDMLGLSSGVVKHLSKVALRLTLDMATAKNGAYISKVEATYKGETLSKVGLSGRLQFSNRAVGEDNPDVISINIKVTDSNGYKASKVVPYRLIEYNTPKIRQLKVKRRNFYEDETELSADIEYTANIDGSTYQNEITVKYWYALWEEGAGRPQMGDVEQRYDMTSNPLTLTFNKNKRYIVAVNVQDSFHSSLFTAADYREAQLDKGVLPFFIDTQKCSVGISCFPADENSLEVDGYNVPKFISQYMAANKSISVNYTFRFIVRGFTGGEKIPVTIKGYYDRYTEPIFIMLRCSSAGAGDYERIYGTVPLTQGTDTLNGEECVSFSTGVNSDQGFLTFEVPLGYDIDVK